MSDSLIGVVVAHGAVARALVDAAVGITGRTDALIPISNDGCTKEDLSQIIDEAVDGHEAVIFVDMPVGSCLHAAAGCARGKPNRSLVAGVNLAMLIDFCFHRDIPPSQAAERAVTKGVDAVKSL